jgi:hypothetical protein
MRVNRPSAPLRIREATFDDYESVTSLASRYGLGTKRYEEWTHLWINNPVYKQMREHWPIGWVLEGQNNQILGSVGNIPLSYEFQGRRLIAASGCSWVVDSRYRSYSILLLERYFDQKNVDLYLNTTVNSQASEAFSVFNSPPVPVGAWDQSAYWITNYSGLAASWLAMKRFRWAGSTSYPLSVLLLLKDVATRRAFISHRNEVKVELCPGFDDRFDRFWGKLKSKNPHLLLGVRTSEALEWHFKHAILKNEVWALTVANASGLLAYSIFCRQDNPRFGLRRMRLVDFQTLDKSPALLIAMLCWALKRCRREGIQMLEWVGLWPQRREIFEELKPHERELPSWSYFYKVRDQKLAQSLANPKVWNPTGFDGDASV